MSLDVYLTGPEQQMPCRCCDCDNEHTKTEKTEFFSANITHNLVQMAIEAGIYNALWRPEEIGIKKAGQLIKPLRDGLQFMESDPARFEKLNPNNGWGSYAAFVPWVRAYLGACESNPEADVNVSR